MSHLSSRRKSEMLTSVVVLVVSIVSIPHSQITARYVIVCVPRSTRTTCVKVDVAQYCWYHLLIRQKTDRVADKRCNAQFSLSAENSNFKGDANSLNLIYKV